MYDNFYKALEDFIGNQIVADEEQTESFNTICQKLKKETVDLFEVGSELIEWNMSFAQKQDEAPDVFQFEFDGDAQQKQLLHEIIIQHIPAAYFSIYMYVELEKYKVLDAKDIQGNVVDGWQEEVQKMQPLEFFNHVKTVIKEGAMVDRMRRIYLKPPEQELLDNIARLVNRYNKAVGAVSAPVTAFFERVSPVVAPGFVQDGVVNRAADAVAVRSGKG